MLLKVRAPGTPVSIPEANLPAQVGTYPYPRPHSLQQGCTPKTNLSPLLFPTGPEDRQKKERIGVQGLARPFLPRRRALGASVRGRQPVGTGSELVHFSHMPRDGKRIGASRFNRTPLRAVVSRPTPQTRWHGRGNVSKQEKNK